MRRWEVFVLAGVLLLSAGVVISAVHRARHRAAKMERINRLREISLGLHNDQGTPGQIPSGFSTDGKGMPSNQPKFSPP